ncbi:MAG: DUF2076 family protein [Devosia sp.]
MLTREDRNAIDGLFERLAEAERTSEPRDPEAEALIRDKIARQPSSPYYLAQTVVVQQEALKEAERRIEALEGQSGRGNRSVAQRGPWDQQPAYGYGGGGFLAGAAQTALGVAGGVLLGSMIGSIFSSGAAQAAEAPPDDQAADAGSDNDGGGNDAGGDDFGGFDGGDGGFDMGGDF